MVINREVGSRWRKGTEPGMDGRRFDILAQRLATLRSRRSILRDGLVAAAAVLAASRRQNVSAQAPCSFALVDCFQNQICVDGMCDDCPEGLAPCQTYCADLLNDPDNCLFCGNQCSSGICESSQCREDAGCDPGLTSCSGQCINLLTDVSNCGVCGVVCEGVSGPGFESDVQCVQGQCSTGCPPGAGLCADECTDLAVDALNCGACGNRCIAGSICCDGRCVGENSAERFCESCGADAGWPQGCDAAETCERGLCIEPSPCEEGLTECAEETCADLHTDPLHCGECGNACGSNECVRGDCQEPLPPAEFSNEGDAIVCLLSLERINQTLLQAGLEMPGLDFDDITRALLDTMVRNDLGHISALRRMSRELGAETIEAAVPSLAIPDSSSIFLQRIARVKELCVSAYADVVERMPGLAADQGLGSIIGVEARHAAFLAMQVEREPFSSDREQALPRPEVLTEVEALSRG